MKKQLFLCAVLCFLTYTAYAADTIKIGLMGSMTGPLASEGHDAKMTVELLADELNHHGGIGGKQVTLIIEDDGGDPRTAALAANRLASQGVVAVVGSYASSITEAAQNIFDEAGIVQISNGSTAIRLTEKGLKMFFRTCPRDDEQAKVAAATMMRMGYKRIAIVHDNTTYSKGLADATRAVLQQQGAQIIFFDAITPGERDYSTILTKLKRAQPQAVYFPGYYPEGGLLLRQKKEMGWNVPFFGGDGMNNADLVKIAGVNAAAGFIFTTPPLPKDLPTPEAKSFLEECRKRYGAPPNSIYGILAGDAFRVIVAGLTATRSTDPAKLAAYLHNGLKDYPGLTGKISFNAKGDRVGEVFRAYTIDAKGTRVLLQ